MERKIGEIFEYDGEWYQCVKGNGCEKCIFNEKKCYTFISDDDPIGYCEADKREDKQDVIFKKLEKVGEPIIVIGRTFQKFTNSDSCVGCVFCNENNGCDKCCYMDEPCLDNEIWIEIKQNKEDMKEKYSELIDIVHEYMDKDMTYKDFKEAINYWVDDYNKLNKETDKLTLKSFDLEAAKSGKPVCTRDGRKARIVCFDKKCLDEQILIVLVDCGKEESIYFYTTDGKCIDDFSSFDLMMLPEKKEGWVNVYDADTTFYYVEGMVYNTKDEAIQKAKEEITTEQREKSEYVDTVKINWEE